MCKVMMTAGIKKEQLPNLKEFTYRMGAVMSQGNSDGLGYAAVNSKGELFGERWLHNNTAFMKKAPKKVSHDGKVVNVFSAALAKPESAELQDTTAPFERNMFGSVTGDDIVAITLHTRFATSAKGMPNTHPFVDSDTSLIHNGVIRNVDKFDLKLSSCDSESILISYLKNEVNKDIAKAQAMAAELVGYYACGVFSRDASGARILDIFKANNSNLSAMYVNELGTWVVATAAVDVRNVCRELGWTISNSFDFRDGVIMRFNPVTGEMVGCKDFELSKSYESFSQGSTGCTATTKNTPHVSYQSGNESYNGAKVLDYSGKKAKNLTDKQISFLRLPPYFREYTGHEHDDFVKNFLAKA